jgi:hypothetical protein
MLAAPGHLRMSGRIMPTPYKNLVISMDNGYRESQVEVKEFL